jgi:integrase
MTLDREDIEAVAARVVALLREAPAPPARYVDAATLALALGVERDWVYARARELGAIRLGEGPKARLRFDLERARAAVAAIGAGDQAPPEEPARRRRRPRKQVAPPGVRLIPGEVWPVSEDRAMLRAFAHDGPAGAPTPPGPAPEEPSDASLRPRAAADAGRTPRRAGALMGRPRRGTLKRRATRQGISYGVAFSLGGREYYEHFGGEWEGWDEQRSLEEQRFLMEKVNRGEWTPPQGAPTPRSEPMPTFQIEASRWLHRRRIRAGDPDGRSKSMRDLEWRLSVVMDKFGDVPIDRVDFALADELVVELCAERLAIEHARERGQPLMRTVRDPRTGRRHQVPRRGVSNGSIRKALDTAERVLRDARQTGLLAGEVPALKAAAPKGERPRRSFLEPEQIAAVLRAAELIEREHHGLTWETVGRIRRSSASAIALGRELGVSDTLVRKVRRGELWTEAPGPRRRNDVPRRVVVETLIFAGVRVSELCGLDAEHLDIAGGRVRVPRTATKTDASERVIPAVPALRERLTEHRMDYPGARSQPAFPTRNGTRQHPDNVRSRILAPIRVRANALLEAEGGLLIAHMTPHTLRRTFASILAVCDVPPRRAMYLMGHTGRQVHAGRLPAGPGHGPGRGRDPRGGAGLHAGRRPRDLQRRGPPAASLRNQTGTKREKGLRHRRRAGLGGLTIPLICRHLSESG